MALKSSASPYFHFFTEIVNKVQHFCFSCADIIILSYFRGIIVVVIYMFSRTLTEDYDTGKYHFSKAWVFENCEDSSPQRSIIGTEGAHLTCRDSKKNPSQSTTNAVYLFVWKSHLSLFDFTYEPNSILNFYLMYPLIEFSKSQSFQAIISFEHVEDCSFELNVLIWKLWRSGSKPLALSVHFWFGFDLKFKNISTDRYHRIKVLWINYCSKTADSRRNGVVLYMFQCFCASCFICCVTKPLYIYSPS